MDKELKRQIKQDEFASGMETAADWLRAHADEARTFVIVLVVVVLAAWGISAYQGHQSHEGERAFGTALETYDAPLASEVQEGQKPAGPVFKTAQEKYQKAVSEFDAVAERYGSSAIGRRARYFAAMSRIELGNNAEAEKALSEIADRDRSAIEGPLARLALAGLYARTGQADKAAQAYQQLADDQSGAIPRDHALMKLAALYEDGRRYAEATKTYQKVVDEFPASSYVADARRKLDLLKPAIEG